MHNNYEDIAFVNLDDFEFQVYVGISEAPLLNSEASIASFPNPFINSTTIQYAVYETSQINITIYNSIGKLVKELVNEQKPKGRYSAKWTARDKFGSKVQPGLYFCRFSCEPYQSILKLLMIE